MIRILTDSTADLLPYEAARLGVELVPLQVTFEDGMSYRDGLDMTPDEFYTRLEGCKALPTTSQPAPGLFLEHFDAAKEAGDDMIAILLSGKLSGTCQSAQIAAATCDYDKIHIVDSITATLGTQLLVRLAVQLRKEGKTVHEIVETLEREKLRVRILAVVNDLKYFRKGGRLSGAEAFAGSVLGIKPLVGVKNGKVSLVGKARGLPGAYVQLFKLLDEAGGLDESMLYLTGYCAHRKAADPINRYLTVNMGLPEPSCQHIGTVVGTHAGPGAAGIAFFAKNMPEEEQG